MQVESIVKCANSIVYFERFSMTVTDLILKKNHPAFVPLWNHCYRYQVRIWSMNLEWSS